MEIAFSTVACPEWTLERVAQAAATWGYDAVELRSFGHGSTRSACDPGLTSGAKVRRLFHGVGVGLAGVASGVRFDAAIFPPVLGHVLPQREASVREGQHFVEIGEDCGAPTVRCFAFDVPRGSGRRGTLRRISDRLARVCDHARHRGVRVLVENGGGFASAEDLAEILGRVASPVAGACYDVAAARAVGAAVAEGAALLGDRLVVARVRDARERRPVPLGTGDLDAEGFVRDLAAAGFAGWLVYEWERAWLDELAPADEVLPGALATLQSWLGGSAATSAA